MPSPDRDAHERTIKSNIYPSHNSPSLGRISSRFAWNCTAAVRLDATSMIPIGPDNSWIDPRSGVWWTPNLRQPSLSHRRNNPKCQWIAWTGRPGVTLAQMSDRNTGRQELLSTLSHQPQSLDHCHVHCEIVFKLLAKTRSSSFGIDSPSPFCNFLTNINLLRNDGVWNAKFFQALNPHFWLTLSLRRYLSDG